MVFSKTFCAAKNGDGEIGILLGVSFVRYPEAEMLFFISEEDGKIRIDHLGDGCTWVERGTPNLTINRRDGKLLFHITDDPLPEKLSDAAKRITDLLETESRRKEIATAKTAIEKGKLIQRQEEIQIALGNMAPDGTILIEPRERKIFKGLMDDLRVATKEELRYQREQTKAHPELLGEAIDLRLRMDVLDGVKVAKESIRKREELKKENGARENEKTLFGR